MFSSKIDLMEAVIRPFEPVAGTLSHVLLDSWFSAKRLWRAARERGFLIITGLKSNRWLRVADPTAVHIATRWEIEVLFGDGNEELGVDQYQLMSVMAIVRFWTLVMLAYVFLEEERDRLQTQWQWHVTSGEARREIQRRDQRHVLDWLHRPFQSGVQPDNLYELLSD